MIQLVNVNKSFKKVQVLQNISLEIKEAQCVVLSGVSGSGKSTLLSIVGSLQKASSGIVEVDEMNLSKLNDDRLSDFRSNTIGFVTQSFHLFDALSVRENILPALLLSRLSQKEINARLEEVMQIANIQHKEDAVVSTLSGGEKQRCVIARALVNKPKILLFDEPTANLDTNNSLSFIKIMKKLKEEGKTILIATHDPLISTLDFIDKVFHMKDGKIE